MATGEEQRAQFLILRSDPQDRVSKDGRERWRVLPSFEGRFAVTSG
jgi:hypothetical protein